jgi:hypothetical protein
MNRSDNHKNIGSTPWLEKQGWPEEGSWTVGVFNANTGEKTHYTTGEGTSPLSRTIKSLIVFLNSKSNNLVIDFFTESGVLCQGWTGVSGNLFKHPSVWRGNVEPASHTQPLALLPTWTRQNVGGPHGRTQEDIHSEVQRYASQMSSEDWGNANLLSSWKDHQEK